jgi:hypothetical protein
VLDIRNRAEIEAQRRMMEQMMRAQGALRARPVPPRRRRLPANKRRWLAPRAGRESPA